MSPLFGKKDQDTKGDCGAERREVEYRAELLKVAREWHDDLAGEVAELERLLEAAGSAVGEEERGQVDQQRIALMQAATLVRQDEQALEAARQALAECEGR